MFHVNELPTVLSLQDVSKLEIITTSLPTTVNQFSETALPGGADLLFWRTAS